MSDNKNNGNDDSRGTNQSEESGNRDIKKLIESTPEPTMRIVHEGFTFNKGE